MAVRNQRYSLTRKAFFRMLLEASRRIWTGPVLRLVAYVDGGSLGNPGPAGIGVIIEGAGLRQITICKWIGLQDNNVAEYVALLEALQCALRLKAKALHVFSDSEVVVRQMTGEYDCRSPRLYSLNWTCRKLARSLHFSISHVCRERNIAANRLASVAARRIPGKGKKKIAAAVLRDQARPSPKHLTAASLAANLA